jgi:hypothetical protein
MSRVYWVQLGALVLKLCRYMQRNNSKLPIELKGQAATVLVALEGLCNVLIQYDATHARGKGVSH